MTKSTADHEAAFMNRATALARRGRGRVEPNPMVGCLLVKGDRVIAEGYHRRFGGPHAEIEALRRAGRAANGATAFVTLEPCSHFGKTPPCTDALIQAGVKRVVVAMKDPFPEVAGRGIRKLKRAGVKVDVGLGHDQAVELNTPYLTLIHKKRPYVILKWAQSIDGKIATRTGDSQWISGKESRRFVHHLRARVDGVMVGINTVLIDDPQLTARDVHLRRIATRVILDTCLRLPPQGKLALTAREVPVLVMASRKAFDAHRRRANRLEKRGVDLQPCRARGGYLDLADVLRHLGRRGMINLLVEGGGQVLTGFLDRRLADEVYAFVSPRLIGGAGAVAPYTGRGAARVDDCIPVQRARSTRVGADTLVQLRL